MEYDAKTRKVIQFFDKDPNCPNNNAFIGLAGILNFEEFFASLENDRSLKSGEMQVSNALEGLVAYNFRVRKFTWDDIGNIEGYLRAKNKYNHGDNDFDFSKTDEYLYFVNGKVIKLFTNRSVARSRAMRAELLSTLIPEQFEYGNNIISYKKFPGNVLYKCEDPIVFSRLIDFLDCELWVPKELSTDELVEFRKRCREFYETKTLSRVAKYLRGHSIEDNLTVINGNAVPTAAELISLVNFQKLSEGIPSGFHGDLQFDNIIYGDNDEFKLIDWRQDFGGLINYGDLYYDLSKLYGGLHVSYFEVKRGQFSYHRQGNSVQISVASDNYLEKCIEIFRDFVERKKLDQKKIDILVGLIFLNMAPMHKAPFSDYIFNFGKLKLYKTLLRAGD